MVGRTARAKLNFSHPPHEEGLLECHTIMVECGEALPDHLGLYRDGFRVSSACTGESEIVSVSMVGILAAESMVSLAGNM